MSYQVYVNVGVMLLVNPPGVQVRRGVLGSGGPRTVCNRTYPQLCPCVGVLSVCQLVQGDGCENYTTFKRVFSWSVIVGCDTLLISREHAELENQCVGGSGTSVASGLQNDSLGLTKSVSACCILILGLL
jgi:hypothetical protein